MIQITTTGRAITVKDKDLSEGLLTSVDRENLQNEVEDEKYEYVNCIPLASSVILNAIV